MKELKKELRDLQAKPIGGGVTVPIGFLCMAERVDDKGKTHRARAMLSGQHDGHADVAFLVRFFPCFLVAGCTSPPSSSLVHLAFPSIFSGTLGLWLHPQAAVEHIIAASGTVLERRRLRRQVQASWIS